MEGLLRAVSTAKNWIFQITEAGFVLVLFIVLIYILLGANSGDFVVKVMANLIGLVRAVGAEALVGISIVLALIYLVKRRA